MESPEPRPKSNGEPKPEHHVPRRVRMRQWMRRHRTASIVLALLLVAFVIFVILLWRYLRSYESTDDAQVDGHISSLGARVAGTVIAVHVDANQGVTKGQLLVELDARDY